MDNMIPRSEYPRPQFVRPEWINLNGQWQFEIDHGDSGIARKFYERESLNGTIIVPFCPESALSGVQYTDFMPAVWYRRTFTLPQNWAGKRVLLHFGAVDYEATVWINGKQAGTHKGGYVSFTFDITDHLVNGENVICLCARTTCVPCASRAANKAANTIPTGAITPAPPAFGKPYGWNA